VVDVRVPDSTDVRGAVSSGRIKIYDRQRGLSHLQYYNGAAIRRCSTLPNFVRELTVEAVPKPRLVATKKRAAGGVK